MKIFLKRKLIDRENARKQEQLQKAAATPPATPTTSITEESSAFQLKEAALAAEVDQSEDVVKKENPQSPSLASTAEVKGNALVQEQEARRDIPQQSIEVQCLS